MDSDSTTIDLSSDSPVFLVREITRKAGVKREIEHCKDDSSSEAEAEAEHEDRGDRLDKSDNENKTDTAENGSPRKISRYH